MAEGHTMTTADVLAKVMAGEHGDLVRDAVTLVAHELMDAEITGRADGARSPGEERLICPGGRERMGQSLPAS